MLCWCCLLPCLSDWVCPCRRCSGLTQPFSQGIISYSRWMEFMLSLSLKWEALSILITRKKELTLYLQYIVIVGVQWNIFLSLGELRYEEVNLLSFFSKAVFELFLLFSLEYAVHQIVPSVGYHQMFSYTNVTVFLECQLEKLLPRKILSRVISKLNRKRVP